MLEVEIAHLLHEIGVYLIITLVVLFTWIASDMNTRRIEKSTLLYRAEAAAQARIRYLEGELSRYKSELKAAIRQAESERAARRAVEQTISRALRIGKDTTNDKS